MGHILFQQCLLFCVAVLANVFSDALRFMSIVSTTSSSCDTRYGCFSCQFIISMLLPPVPYYFVSVLPRLGLRLALRNDVREQLHLFRFCICPVCSCFCQCLFLINASYWNLKSMELCFRWMMVDMCVLGIGGWCISRLSPGLHLWQALYISEFPSKPFIRVYNPTNVFFLFRRDSQ